MIRMNYHTASTLNTSNIRQEPGAALRVISSNQYLTTNRNKDMEAYTHLDGSNGCFDINKKEVTRVTHSSLQIATPLLLAVEPTYNDDQLCEVKNSVQAGASNTSAVASNSIMSPNSFEFPVVPCVSLLDYTRNIQMLENIKVPRKLTLEKAKMIPTARKQTRIEREKSSEVMLHCHDCCYQTIRPIIMMNHEKLHENFKRGITSVLHKCSANGCGCM